MPKNIVIFSDGTGQDGGVRPEQRMSNIFKMYRATRPGPDSEIDPREQVAFYDAGLGTDAGASGVIAVRRWLAKLLSSVTGRGITTNIADAYEFIINHYRPGDRIWLFGFSRGAYTARSVATVLRLCGVPTKVPGSDLPRFRYQVRGIAEHAVIRVAEHGAGRPRGGRYEAEREELARRFRIEHGSDCQGEANAAPYFIGVFDTVASLGAKGPLRIFLGGLLALSVIGAAAAIASLTHWLSPLGWGTSFLVAAALIATFTAFLYLRTSLKVFKPLAGGRRRFHLAQWSGRYYDRLLGKAVVYARHAIAIDENRADFPRVPWGPGKGIERRPEIDGEPKPFVQMWFAGNHSDIGGSYPEAESRLSDIALGWMLDEARSVPHPLMVDGSRIHIYPAACGLQHDEIAGMNDTVRQHTPAWLRWLTRSISWKASMRDPKVDATMHPSVADRFAAPSVPRQGRDEPYRPAVLRDHELFRAFYQ